MKSFKLGVKKKDSKREKNQKCAKVETENFKQILKVRRPKPKHHQGWTKKSYRDRTKKRRRLKSAKVEVTSYDTDYKDQKAEDNVLAMMSTEPEMEKKKRIKMFKGRKQKILYRY